MIIKKITSGFVTQTFDNGDCLEQNFTAGDDCDYEYEDGTAADEIDDYAPFDMVQPSSSKQIQTVNVVRTSNFGTISELKSFHDNEQGNDLAEKVFTKWVKEEDSSISEDDMDVILMEGYFEISDGKIILARSN